MIELGLALLVAALAWLSARLGVIAAIHRSNSAQGMLNSMIWETHITVILVLLLWWLSNIAWAVIPFLIVRMLFLIMTDWLALCDHYEELKKLIS